MLFRSGVGSLPRWSQGWDVGYDRGFLIAPTSDEQSPFSLKITNQTMFRYAGFLREVETWTDKAGDVHSVNNFSNFQIPRGRLSFAGGALVPDLSYQVIIDYNTVTSTPIGFRAYLLSYEFSDALTVHVGQNKVPGTREWLTSAFQVQGPDRSLATTFFRPSLSQGIWITGRVADDFHYHAMLSNGFNTSNLPARDLNVYPCWSGSIWWEPWGDFGKDMSDLQWHEQPALRVGTSRGVDGCRAKAADPFDGSELQVVVPRERREPRRDVDGEHPRGAAVARGVDRVDGGGERAAGRSRDARAEQRVHDPAQA